MIIATGSERTNERTTQLGSLKVITFQKVGSEEEKKVFEQNALPHPSI